MNIDELDNRLNKEFSAVYKRILIDGDWGIGKTYLIKNKYKNNENYKVIYASLFGVNSISELNLYILNELNRFVGTIKKGYDNFVGGKDFGVLAITLPMPKIKSGFNFFIKKEVQKKKVLIIIDDIERKSVNININELMGFFENIANLENTELILIANTEKISEKDSFEDFKEKIIEKTYNVDSYSDKAENIIIKNNLKDYPDLSKLVSKFFNKYNSNNLRTLTKCINFIKQNLNYLDFEKLTYEQKADIIEFEILIVLEKIINEYKKLEYTEISSYGIDTLVLYINEKYFNKSLIYYKSNILESLSKIFDDTEIEENFKKINAIYESINNPSIEDIEKIDPFYLSEEQLKIRIKKFNNNYMNKTSDDLNIFEWFKQLSYLYNYSEKAGLQNELKEDYILTTMDLYLNQMETFFDERDIYRNFFGLQLDSKKMKYYFEILKNKMNVKQYDMLFKTVKDDFDNKKYTSEYYTNFITNLNNIKDNTITKELIENEFFIPDLNKELTETIWDYTHNIWNNIKFIDDKSDFISVIKKRLTTSSKLGKYRIESLNNQYNIQLQI